MSNALCSRFDAFVGSMYADNSLPPVHVVPALDAVQDNTRKHYTRTGMMPVLSEDESVACPVFANWATHYEYEAWAAYRQMTHSGKAFQAMVTDVLDRNPWSPEVAEFITIIDGLLNVHKKYEEKYNHAPVDKNKFIKSYVKNGKATVLNRDTY